MNDRPPSDVTVATGPPTELGPDTAVASSPVTASDSGFVVDSGVEQLVADWESSGSPAALSEYLPDTAAIRRAALVELIKVDLEYRWLRSGQPKRLADYCLEFPELLAEPLPADLLYEEFRVRRDSGDKVEADDYLKAYPTQANRFEGLLTLDSHRQPRTSEPTVGDAFDVGARLEDFELVRELGRGAFARVFLARQHSMQRWVALKISRNVGTEPQTMAQLDHPYIVRVFDQRLLEERQLRLLFMEYVPGGTLLDVVRLVRATPPTNAQGNFSSIRSTVSSTRKERCGPKIPACAARSLPCPGLRPSPGSDYASPTPSNTRANTECCTATSNRRMSCSVSRACPNWPTST